MSQLRSRPEINQLQIQSLEIDQEIFILDIPMNDPLPMTSDDGLDDLLEELPGQLLLHDALLSDEVEEVFAGLRSLHHDDVGIVALETVDQTDNTRKIGDGMH